MSAWIWFLVLVIFLLGAYELRYSIYKIFLAGVGKARKWLAERRQKRAAPRETRPRSRLPSLPQVSFIRFYSFY